MALAVGESIPNQQSSPPPLKRWATRKEVGHPQRGGPPAKKWGTRVLVRHPIICHEVLADCGCGVGGDGVVVFDGAAGDADGANDIAIGVF